MLPKPEKIRKNSSSDSDSDVKEVSLADKAKQKRLLLILVICLTIGLSTLFSLYNYFRNFHFTLPNFNPPQISLNQTPLESQLKSLLGKDYSNWSFTVQTNSSDPFFWTTNPNPVIQDFPTLASTIEQYHQPIDPELITAIPVGLKTIQFKNENRFQLVVVTPEKQLYFDINFPPTGSSQLKEVISLMYWALVNP
jgi:hypothetical protein